MNTRDLSLKQMRPEILTATINDNMSSEERFQNLVLRPVIKLQNGLLIAAFRNYILKHKSVFYGLTLQKRMDYIENAIHKDMKFRNVFKGMVIGQFTLEEYSQVDSPYNTYLYYCAAFCNGGKYAFIVLEAYHLLSKNKLEVLK